MKKIEDALAVCEGYYDTCRELFGDEKIPCIDTEEDIANGVSCVPSIPRVENLLNCYEMHGFEKTGEFCLTKESVVDDHYFYKLKNKYSCLADTHNEFPMISVPDEVSECLNQYYDYKIETCLQDFEN